MKIKFSIIFLSIIAFFGFISPSVALADTFFVTGNVSNSNYMSLENVTVSAIDSETDVVIDTTTTDVDGNYALTVTDGIYDLIAEYPIPGEYQPVIYSEQQILDNAFYDFLLIHQVTVGGTITGSGGVPLENVTIEVVDSYTRSVIESVVTDNNGEYIFTVVDGIYDLVATPSDPEEYQSLTLSNQSFYADETKNMSLLHNVTIQGLVKNEDDIPLENIGILIKNSETDEVVTSASTDSNGLYSVNVTDGTYDVVAVPNPLAYQSLSFTDQEVTLDAQLDFTLTATVYYEITGNVTAGSIGNKENVIISARDNSTNELITTSVTDANGNYTLSVPAGNYLFIADPAIPEQFKVENKFDQIITGNTVINFHLSETQYYTLDGHITDKADNGVGGIEVKLAGQSTTTDNTGYYSFTLPEYTGGVFPILVSNGNTSQHLPQYFTIYTGNGIPLNDDTQLDIKLPSILATIEVKNESLATIENAHVTLTSVPVSDQDKIITAVTNTGTLDFYLDMGKSVMRGNTDNNGAVSLNVFPVSIMTQVNSPVSDYLDTYLESQKYEEDTIIPVTLPSAPVTYTVSGTITDKNGVGVIGMQVTFGNEYGNFSTYTDGSGYYSIGNLLGYTRLTLRSGYAPSLPSGMAFEAQKQIDGSSGIYITDNTTLDMQIPSHQLTVQVTDESSSPVENARVKVFRYRTSDTDQFFTIQSSLGELEFYNTQETSVLSQGTTDATGNVVVNTLPVNTKVYVESQNQALSDNSIEPYTISEDTLLPMTLYNVQ